MLTQVSKKTWIKSAIVSAVCFLIFIILNFVSSVNIDTDKEASSITKKEALQRATLFIEQQTGATVTRSEVVYDSPKVYTGYLDKHDATKAHYENIDNVYPAEFFTVYAILDNLESEVTVDLNVANGQITGWSFPLSEQLVVDEASEALVIETLKSNHFPTENMMLDQVEDGTFVATNETKLTATDASISVNVKVTQLDGKPFVVEYEPVSSVPASYVLETTSQDELAGWYTGIGFILMSVIMGILAIVYAFLYRRFTSFKYGIIFTAIATIISCIGQMSMMKPTLILEQGNISFDQFMLIFMNIIVLISVIVSAISYYFSFVAGDGLWKAQGFNLWPRFKEQSFGKTVWNSMLLGFLFALSGFGIQAVIFEGLGFIIGTHQAVDATQSPLNSTMLWFYPLLAWMAAISEEAVYRYFGVGIFRRWFKNTYVAAIIPSLVWAFGHTLYPLYPVSTRIIELVIIGVLLTWVMVKFGLLTVIFTHAIFNTIAMSLSLFSYGETFDIVMGVLYIVMPIVIAYIIKVIHARYIKNKPEPPAPHHYEEQPMYYQPQQPNQF